MRWRITDKGDSDARKLVDGEVFNLNKPHYSRQTPGAAQFTRNGQNLVFLTPDVRAVWVTFRPTPSRAVRPDGLDGWECALFRNESAFGGQVLSSELITEAVELSFAIWGTPGLDGFFTFIKPECVKSVNPGYCYKKAGWKLSGHSKDGKPRYTSPAPLHVRSVYEWGFKGERGGKLRREIDERWEAQFA